MKKLIRRISSINKPEYEAYSFYCPGCEHYHVFYVKGEKLSWTFNGDMESPTFSPSLLVTTTERRCHLHVQNGQIIYCPDCTHELSGKTIPLQNTEVN